MSLTIIINTNTLPTIEKSNGMFVSSLFGLSREDTFIFLYKVKQAHHNEREPVSLIDIYEFYKDYPKMDENAMITDTFVIIKSREM